MYLDFKVCGTNIVRNAPFCIVCIRVLHVEHQTATYPALFVEWRSILYIVIFIWSLTFFLLCVWLKASSTKVYGCQAPFQDWLLLHMEIFFLVFNSQKIYKVHIQVQITTAIICKESLWSDIQMHKIPKKRWDLQIYPATLKPKTHINSTSGSSLDIFHNNHMLGRSGSKIFPFIILVHIYILIYCLLRVMFSSGNGSSTDYLPGINFNLLERQSCVWKFFDKYTQLAFHNALDLNLAIQLD